jgi:hypothetical protein
VWVQISELKQISHHNVAQSPEKTIWKKNPNPKTKQLRIIKLVFSTNRYHKDPIKKQIPQMTTSYNYNKPKENGLTSNIANQLP